MKRERLAYGCPVRGCQMLKSRSHLLCEAHWEKLPRGPKQRVLNAYARYIATERGPGWLPEGPEKTALTMAWRKAARDAITYFTGNHEEAA